MKFITRLKFIFGIFVVIMIVAGLFLYLDNSMSMVHSTKARLQSDSYTVGVDYSGVVEKTYIKEGDYVKSGDPLFEVRSSTLADAIRNNEVAKSSLLYSLTGAGKVRIDAAANGRVQTIQYNTGAFVPANSEIATIDLDDGLFVNATYKLSSPDYARISYNSKVDITFPDNTKLTGSVYDISLDVADKEVLTTVRVRVDAKQINTTAFKVGTPVDTTLHLDGETWYNKILNAITSLFQPKSGS